MKYSLLFCLFSFLILSTSCGDDDDPNGTPENCSTAFTASFEDELQAVNTASTNYGSDPSAANCEAFKSAYNDYIDALDGWEECANFYNQVDQWEQSLDAARAAIDNLVC